jgi:hypothetical protein
VTAMAAAAQALLATLPLALDGESVTGNNVGIAVLSVVSMIFGYALIAALWYFVFSPKAADRRRARTARSVQRADGEDGGARRAGAVTDDEP